MREWSERVRMRRCGGVAALSEHRLIKLSSPAQQQATLRERQKGITHIILSDAELMVALRWYEGQVDRMQLFVFQFSVQFA